MMGIRIVERIHAQPTLFGMPILSTTYTLVDENEQSLLDEQGKPYSLPSLAAAERKLCAILGPVLRRMAYEYAESEASHERR